LGRFLTDDSPYDGLKKTVEELEEYNPEGVETCGTLAFKYSKQIFEIFNNKEDPNFPWLAQQQVPSQNDKKWNHVY